MPTTPGPTAPGQLDCRGDGNHTRHPPEKPVIAIRKIRYSIAAPAQILLHLRYCGMASVPADEMVREMANVLRERRIKIGASKNALAASSFLDRAALHRAEAGERIPSLAFWVDWSDTLGVPLERVIREARKRVGNPRLSV